jgi:hypothetical protein
LPSCGSRLYLIYRQKKGDEYQRFEKKAAFAAFGGDFPRVRIYVPPAAALPGTRPTAATPEEI